MQPPQLFILSQHYARSTTDAGLVSNLMTNATNRGVVVTFVDDDAGRLVAEEYARDLHHRSALQDELTQVAEFPLLPFSGPNNNQLSVVQIINSARFALVVVRPIATLATPWPVGVAHANQETVISIVHRSASSPAASADVWADLATTMQAEANRLNFQHILSVYEDISGEAVGTFSRAASDTGIRRHAFECILAARSRLHEVGAHLRSNGLNESVTASELRDATSGLDAMSTSLAAMVGVITEEHALAAEKRDKAREQRAVERDRLIARIGAALLLPGLWFGFMGTNVLPPTLLGVPVPGNTATAIALGVGVILALLGWFSIPHVLSDARKGTK